MASNSLSPIVYQLQEGLRNVDLRSWTNGFDLQNFVSSIDIKTVGFIALAVVAFLFILDFFTKSYAPYGRSLAVSAANAWENNRDQLGLGDAGRGSRSLEPLTEVLDALAEAVKKWEEPEDSAVRNRAFQ